MARVTEQLRDWLGRAEMLARGLDGFRRHALEALDAGRPWDARADALQILAELPRSAIALALWADAAEALMLDEEASEALERLATELPFRADVWLRLAGVARRLGREQEPLLERAAQASDPVDAADSARLTLLDVALDRGELERAERWLEELGPGTRELPDSRRRVAELALESGEPERARRIEAALPDPRPIDGRGWLLRGRLLAPGDEPRASHAFARALLLEAPGAERAVSRFVGRARDPNLVAGLFEIVQTLGRAERPIWRAAFATQQGRPAEGLALLAEAARQAGAGSRAIADYAESAIELRDAAALADAAALGRRKGWALAPDVEQLVQAQAEADPGQRLGLLDGIEGQALSWAAELRRAVFGGWLPSGRRASWRELLQQAALLGEELGDPGVLAELRPLALDLERPLRVAVIGEFNAGKSSFINALLGETVAPTGVLPTTASVNHVLWGTEKNARVEFRDLRPSLALRHAEVGATLRGLDARLIERVEIHAPLEVLRTLEIIDTPGFNAPERQHAVAARAAIGEAHVVFWLLDAAQAFKESERAVVLELAQQGLPLFVLINKRDRLARDELEPVVGHVAASLAGLGVVAEAAPVLFSARQALAGRAGDAEALADSNWREVAELIDQLVAARSQELRERVLRGRFRRVLASLREHAERASSRRRIEIDRRRARNRTLLELSQSVRERRTMLAARIGGLVEQRSAELWPVSLSGLGPLNPAERRLLVDQARATLAEELLALLLEATGVAAELGEELRPALEVRVGVLVAALAPALARPSLGEVAFGGGARASLIAHLSELVVEELLLTIKAAQVPPEHAMPSRAERRLHALGAALDAESRGQVQSDWNRGLRSE